MPVADAPINELGYVGGLAPTLGVPGQTGPSFYVDGAELNTDLGFPLSATVYDRMRTEDGQVGAVARAVTLSILGAGRRLKGTGVAPNVMTFCNAELGLDIVPGRARRRREGIVLAEHLREALLHLWFGFMPFEQVYSIGPLTPDQADPEHPAKLYAHLRKLAPRMPRTLRQVVAARDGGLAGILQEPTFPGLGYDPRGVFIPTDRLVMYVNEREGANWTGRSLLRNAYKHWLLKDALIRLGAQIVERNGMGVPIATIDDESKRGKALALVKAFRAGAESGGVLEPGITLQLLGVTGSTVDPMPWTKYHDEAIGRTALAMFLNLGHDAGLGSGQTAETFVDYFTLSLNTVAAYLGEVITEHVIRDLVELNFGPDEPYPVLEFDPISSESTPTAEALKALADAKLITPDDVLEADLRRRRGLPAIDKGSRPAPPVVAPPPIPPGADGVVVNGHPAPPPPPDGASDAALTARLEAVYRQIAALRGVEPSAAMDDLPFRPSGT